MNQGVLVGRYCKEVQPLNDNEYVLSIQVARPHKNDSEVNEQDTIECLLTKGLMEPIKANCAIGDLMGTRGHLETRNDKLYFYIEKVTFLSSKQEE